MKQCSVKGNPSRFYFITREEAEKVLDGLPRCPMAAVIRPEPFRRLAVPVGALRPTVGRRGLGARSDHRSLAQDRTA